MTHTTFFAQLRAHLLSLAIFFIAILSMQPIQAQGLKLASDVYPPFTDVSGEKAIAMEIVQGVLERMEQEVGFAIVDFEDVINGVREGRFDGSAALWHSNEREDLMYFSAPYMENRLVLVGRKGSNIDYKKLDDLVGKNVGIVGGYAYGLDAGAGVILIATKSDQQSLSQLLSGKLDYILVDALVISYMLKYLTNDVSALLEIGQEPFMRKGLHFALSREVQGGGQLVKQFDKHYREMLAEGKINEILGMTAIRADVTGDGKLELVLSGSKVGSAPDPSAYALTLVPPTRGAGAERIYHEGKLYEGWGDLPRSLKQEPDSQMKPEDAGIKIKLSRSGGR